MIKNLLFGTGNHKGVAVNLGLLLGRLGLGLMLAFLHGINKLPPSERFIAGIGDMGFPGAVLFAWAASLAEFAGGLLIAAGLLTRPAAAAVGFTMIVAAFLAHGADPMDKKELALLYLSGALVFMLAGAGKYSLDQLFAGRKK